MSENEAGGIRRLGEMILERRMELGYSQRELASICGVSNSQVSRIEAGAGAPTPDTLKKLAGPLGLDFEKMMRLAGHLPDEVNIPQAAPIKPKRRKERVERNYVFAERLRVLRETHDPKLTRDDLAKQLDLTYAALAAYELGRVPDAKTLGRIADFFGVTIDYLLGRHTQPQGTQEFIVYEGISIGWEPGPDADQAEWLRYVTELISAVKNLTEEDRRLALSIVRSIKIHKKENSKDDQ